MGGQKMTNAQLPLVENLSQDYVNRVNIEYIKLGLRGNKYYCFSVGESRKNE